MNLIDMIRVVIDDSVGTRGAVENCRRELARRLDEDDAVRGLRRRLDECDGHHTPAAVDHHRPAS